MNNIKKGGRRTKYKKKKGGKKSKKYDKTFKKLYY